MNRQLRLLLLVISLITLLIVAVSLTACKNNSEKLTVTYDNTHTTYEGDDLESIKPYLTITYTDKDGKTITVTDYELDGTLTKGECTVTVKYNNLTATCRITVLEQTTPNTYTVTFKADGSIVGTQTYTADNKNITEPSVPNKIGYIGEWENYTLTAENTTVNAVYIPISYTITFKSDNTVIDTKTYTVENKNITEPTIPNKTGYTSKWEKYTLTTGDLTVNAVYTAKEYTITLNYDGATGGNTQQTITVTYDQPIGTLPTPIKDEYDFCGWKYNDLSVDATTVWNIDNNAILIAVWRISLSGTEGIQYTLNDDNETYSVTGIGTAIDTNLVIPATFNEKSVTSIGELAFYNCNSITSVVIGRNITTIGGGAFANCKELTNITIPRSIKLVEIEAFVGCDNISTIYFEGDLKDWCSWQGTFELMQCAPNATLIIDSQTLKDELIIPEGTLEISGFAFLGRGITNVTIPESITAIDYSAFEDCNELVNINYLGTMESWCQIEGLDNLMRYGATNKTLVIDGNEIADDLVIPDTVTSIPSCAFYQCSNIKSVIIPASVTSIGGNYDHSSSAFYNCSYISSIKYLGTIESWCQIEGLDNLMQDGTSDRTLIIDAKEITGDLVIPDTVTSIPSCAFYRCSNIESVTVPVSVTTIGAHAYTGCNIATINYLGTIENWCNASLLELRFCGTSNRTLIIDGNELTGELVIPDSVTYIPLYAFYNTNITSVIIPNSVTNINAYAFELCDSLTSVTIPESVTHIANYAFCWCINLQTVRFTGTIEQWESIVKDDNNWNQNVPATKVICSNGEVAL